VTCPVRPPLDAKLQVQCHSARAAADVQDTTLHQTDRSTLGDGPVSEFREVHLGSRAKLGEAVLALEYLTRGAPLAQSKSARPKTSSSFLEALVMLPFGGPTGAVRIGGIS